MAMALAPVAQAGRRPAPSAPITALQAEGDPLPSGDPSINLMQVLLESLGISPTQQFIVDNARADPSQDLFSPYGHKVKNQPAGIDMQATMTAGVHISADAAPLLGQCDGMRLVCAGNPPAAGYYYSYMLVTRGPITPAPGAYVEVGVAILDGTPLDGKAPAPWKPGSFAPNDIYKGANTAWSFNLDHYTDPTQLTASGMRQFHGKGQAAFTTEPSDAFLVTGESGAAVFIPQAEWSGAENLRIFTFLGSANQQLADTYPDISEPALTFDTWDSPSIEMGATSTASPTTAGTQSAEPVASEIVPVVTEGVTPAPTASEVAVVGPPGTSPGPSPPAATVITTQGGLDLYGLILLMASGLFLLILGGFLVLRPGKPVPAPAPAGAAGGQPAAGGVSPAFPLAAFENDPCPELARQLAIARHACEEARAAAAAAKTKADAAHAAATKSRTAAQHAQQERQRMERLVHALEQPPDPGGDSVSSHGETLTEYDLQLRAENDAAANAWHQDARASAVAAGADAGALQQLADEWGKRLNTPISDLRSRDAAQRAQRLAKARRDLQAAQATEHKADAGAQRAEQSAGQADAAADEAARKADQACAQADKAERDHAACVEKKRAEEAAAAEAARKKREAAAPPPAASPTPPETAPPPQPPSGKPCPPPDEEWRHERSAGHFVVPVDGARITWTAEPSLRGLDEWVAGQPWDGPVPEDQDPDEPVKRQDASVSRAQFKTLNPAVVRRGFSDLAHPSQPIELSMRVTIPVHTVYVDCERKWECQGGHLMRTSHTRTVLSSEAAPAHAGTWNFHMTAPQPHDIGRFIIQVQRALGHLEKSQYDLDNARLSCSE